MKGPKILLKHMTSSITNGISGYPSCAKLGIFIRISQSPKSIEDMSVHKITLKIEKKKKKSQ